MRGWVDGWMGRRVGEVEGECGREVDGLSVLGIGYWVLGFRFSLLLIPYSPFPIPFHLTTHHPTTSPLL
jgi:hypothetical protein